VTAVLTELAPAKVNLSLLVTGRRTDGYHLLDSMVVFGPVGDRVHARSAATLTLEITGPFAAGLAAGSSNLVVRAARSLAAWAGRPAHAAIVLEKHLPIASGIGGGSADAAATLRVLCRLWDLAPSQEALAAMGLALGADVPVCLASRPARMMGVGETLLPLPPLPQCGLLLVNPGLAVATADVFRARSAAFSPTATPPAAWPTAEALAASLAVWGNDLEMPARILAPVISSVLARLQELPGCLLARMSGSGATCFGLFPDPATAQLAATELPSEWWRCAGPLYEPSAAALLTDHGWGVAKR
jgi:4-diphosphocytidyl-2-C-methyl-D-erythritol kinase